MYSTSPFNLSQHARCEVSIRDHTSPVRVVRSATDRNKTFQASLLQKTPISEGVSLGKETPRMQGFSGVLTIFRATQRKPEKTFNDFMRVCGLSKSNENKQEFGEFSAILMHVSRFLGSFPFGLFISPVGAVYSFNSKRNQVSNSITTILASGWRRYPMKGKQHHG